MPSPALMQRRTHFAACPRLSRNDCALLMLSVRPDGEAYRLFKVTQSSPHDDVILL